PAGLINHVCPGGRSELVIVAELGEGPGCRADLADDQRSAGGAGPSAARAAAPGRQSRDEDRAGGGAAQDLQPIENTRRSEPGIVHQSPLWLRSGLPAMQDVYRTLNKASTLRGTEIVMDMARG